MFTNFEIMGKLSPEIHFFFEKKVTLRDRVRLKEFVGRMFQQLEKPLGSLNFIFCSDPYLLRINREYLSHDYLTDIITFDLSGGSGPVQGEVYISVDRVLDNAAQLGKTRKEELHRVIFHGVLHLCGFRDKTARDQKQMRTMEDYFLEHYFR